MVTDSFRKANEHSRGKKVSPTLEVEKIFTPFVQKWLNLSDLLDPILNLEVGASIMIIAYSASRSNWIIDCETKLGDGHYWLMIHQAINWLQAD